MGEQPSTGRLPGVGGKPEAGGGCVTRGEGRGAAVSLRVAGGALGWGSVFSCSRVRVNGDGSWLADRGREGLPPALAFVCSLSCAAGAARTPGSPLFVGRARQWRSEHRRQVACVPVAGSLLAWPHFTFRPRSHLRPGQNVFVKESLMERLWDSLCWARGEARRLPGAEAGASPLQTARQGSLLRRPLPRGRGGLGRSALGSHASVLSAGLHVFPTFVLYELTILMALTLLVVIMKVWLCDWHHPTPLGWHTPSLGPDRPHHQPLADPARAGRPLSGTPL